MWFRLESTTNTLFVTDSLEEAGSFGGLFTQTETTNEILGMTAAHCLEAGIPDQTTVTTPSTLEVNARLQSILRYTTLCDDSKKIHQRRYKEREVRSLLATYPLSFSPLGLSMKTPDTGILVKGFLNGSQVGTVHKRMDCMQTGVLYRHDEYLLQAGYQAFGLGRECLSRLDWCTFRCAKSL